MPRTGFALVIGAFNISCARHANKLVVISPYNFVMLELIIKIYEINNNMKNLILQPMEDKDVQSVYKLNHLP